MYVADLVKNFNGEKLIEKITELDIPHKTASFKKNELIVEEGKIDSHFYIVDSGLISFSVTNSDKLQVITRFLNSNTWFGSANFLLDSPFQFNVTALRDTKIRIYNRNDILRLFQTDSDGFWFLYFDGYSQVHERNALVEIAHHDPRRRLISALLYIANTVGIKTDDGISFPRGITQNHLALVSQVPRTRANVELQKLREQGIIRLKPKPTVILDILKLREQLEIHRTPRTTD
ncbi:Crp/Fnr family transcriptional regulator [Listeria grandensis]|uniref:Crp/Fnr family transcriptional regulator n=2 Tax=Listeria grandensis TaxID=1494963 RepID=A0A7X0Y6D0_9LIST|nr:Crp/Fnr family transcriptional regulator [Listeria grandensis]EUJ23545.1 putative CRP/FNR family transcriptional regulator [Listeria grandensis FSL F6-0971]MBC1475247.1 Crp/Fnr family transcriptional regulator [Listeria grandensis]MBC1937831.1 Crp/Fnr family transcriptional regulator [Listeria grandensis]MBC6314298.1 Crp/Fnr family transcriptional regulator [Listeria grandensis]